MAPKDSIYKAAQAQADGDAALLEALKDRDGDIPAAPEQPQSQTLQDAYLDVVGLITKAKNTSRLSEPTLLKLWELQLGWTLQMRQQAQQESQYSNPPYPVSGSEGDGESLPEPHEVITEDISETEENA